jgi:hypothetical protein
MTELARQEARALAGAARRRQVAEEQGALPPNSSPLPLPSP